jgi:predicted HicB family RNase H-like nuclease
MTPIKVTYSGRIPPELLEAAKAKAAEQGTNLTAVIIRALERYVKSK